MANEAIYELIAEPSLNAADRFVVQQTSAATRATSATFALMGGLEINSTFDTAADHADIAADAGKLYLVNTSALASDMNFTLPIAANVQTGERVGVFLTTGDATQELDLKSGASGDLINGVDHSTNSWSRLFITGETVIFRCIDGSTGDWMVEQDGRIACTSLIYLDAVSPTISSSTNVEWTTFDTNGSTEAYDVGGICDESTGRVTIRRTGRYLFSALATSSTTIADGTELRSGVQVDVDTTGSWIVITNQTPGAANNVRLNSHITYEATDGEVFGMVVWQSDSSSETLHGETGKTGFTNFSCEERL